MAEVESVTLEIEPEKWHSLFAYLEHLNDTKFKGCELSGHGEIVMVKPGVFRLTKLYFTEQFAEPAHTELGPGFGKLWVNMPAKNRKRMRFWWHSHTTFSVYWSQTDEKNIERWAKEMGYLFSLVINEENEYKIRFDMVTPITISEVDVNIKVNYELSRKTKNKIIKDLHTKLKKKPVKVVKYTKVKKGISRRMVPVTDDTYWDKQERLYVQSEEAKVSPCRDCEFLKQNKCIYPDCNYDDIVTERLQKKAIDDKDFDRNQLVVNFYGKEARGEKVAGGATKDDGKGNTKVERTVKRIKNRTQRRNKKAKRTKSTKEQAN